MIACHDGTAFADVECSKCGRTNHLHESQLPLPLGVSDLVGVRCSGCRAVMLLDIGALAEALTASRGRMAGDAR